jgi:hypothetical protein
MVRGSANFASRPLRKPEKQPMSPGAAFGTGTAFDAWRVGGYDRIHVVLFSRNFIGQMTDSGVQW